MTNKRAMNYQMLVEQSCRLRNFEIWTLALNLSALVLSVPIAACAIHSFFIV